MMKEDTYVAGQIERALHADPRTHELGVRVEVDGGELVLRGEVASEERRRLIAQVAGEQSSGMAIRDEVSVTPVLSAEAPEVLPLPEEVAPSEEVPPPHQALS
jgi:hypothetical protein